MDDELLPNLLDDVPAALGELIGAVGRGVADAQQALDRSTIDQISRIYGDLDDEAQAYLRAIGYQPTWYKIPELKADLLLTLTVAGGDGVQRSAGRGVSLHATPVDANYANKYRFNLEAASRVSFTVVPVPPTAQAEEMVVVPKLTGRTEAVAAALLDELGLTHDLDPGSDRIVDSLQPAGGTLVRPGEAVLTTTRDPDATGGGAR